jgi:AAA15 family ATPase/GTPase
MLLDFSVSNFRSFREEQSLSMIPGGEGSDEFEENIALVNGKWRVLKTAVLFGANASGKSNFMQAFRAFRELILNSGENDPDEDFSVYQPFAFNPKTLEQPTVFQINFLLGGIRYYYKLAINRTEVLEEVLNFYPKGREARLFQREKQDFEFGDFLKGAKSTVEKLTAPNQLYLSKAALNSMEQAVDIYRYFSRDFLPIPFLDSWSDRYYVNRLAKEVERTDGNQNFVNNFKLLLQSFDTGLLDFRIQSRPFSDDYDIEVKHAVYDDNGKQIGETFQPFEEESTGTQKLFVIGGLILRALMNGRVIMIDEFERSLHPFISSLILRLFNQSNVNLSNAQLIIATHDAYLLSRGNQLRRDQIYLVEKDKTGRSEIFSLSDVEGIRKEAPYEKWYLSGRLGGVPTPESLNFELNFHHGAEVR